MATGIVYATTTIAPMCVRAETLEKCPRNPRFRVQGESKDDIAADDGRF